LHLWGGVYSQFAAQSGGALIVDAQGGGAVAVAQVQRHELAIGGFAQESAVMSWAGQVNGRLAVFGGFGGGQAAFQGLQVKLTQAGSLWGDPVVVAGGEQVAAIVGDGLLPVGKGDGGGNGRLLSPLSL
jgi:hypothetical protein